MPAPLHEDAVAYLTQNKMPINTQSLNRTMQLMGQRPDLRPSYAGMGGEMDVDVDTMKPVIKETGPLPPLSRQSNTDNQSSQSFGSAFADARKRMGATGEFEWNGKKYHTRYKDEVATETPQKTPQLQSSGVNKEAEAEMQEDLMMEKSGADAIDIEDAQQEYTSSPNAVRGNLNKHDNSDMEKMLAAIGIGGAGAAAIGYGMKRDKNRAGQPMARGDLYPTQDPNEELATGKMKAEPESDGPRTMTDADVFGKPKDPFEELLTGMLPEEDVQPSMLDEFEQNVADGNYVREEQQAVQALKTNNKIQARKLIPRLESLGKDVDVRLITALKALL